MHIPKTAGTSFIRSFSRLFDPKKQFPGTKLLAKYNGKYPPVREIEKYGYHEDMLSADLIYGHYPLRFITRYIQPNVKICFLREPIQRTVSNLHHLKLQNPHLEDHTLDELIDDQKLLGMHFDNLQTRYLLSHNPSELTQEHAFEAVEALGSFHFGLTEEYNLSLKRMSQSLSARLKVRKENTLVKNSSEHGKKISPISEQLMAKIKSHNRVDIKLYAEAARLF